jgi:hypothetical protein
MTRNIRRFLAPAALSLLLTAYYASVWMPPAPAVKGAFVSGLGAGMVILACCILLYFLYQHLLSGSSSLVAVLYAVLAAAHPAALYFSPFHIGVLLMALCMYCYLHFNAGCNSTEYLFITWAAFSAACIFLPPLAWLMPVLLLSSITKATGKRRFLAVSLAGLLLPLAAWTGIRFLLRDPAPTSFLSGMWTQMTALQLPRFNQPVVAVVRIAMTAAVTMTAICCILPWMSRFRTAEFHACLRLIFLTGGLAAIALLFLSEPLTPACLLVMLPVAPLLSRFLVCNAGGRLATLLFTILALLLVADRIALFVNP